MFRRNVWPVCASLGVHGALGGVLLISGATSPPREAQVIERDIWIGETLEAVENGRDPSERTTGPASLTPPATPPVHGADVASPPPKAAVTPPPAGDRQATLERHESLAARILSYEPGSSKAMGAADGKEDPPTSAHKTSGGMDRIEDVAPTRAFAKAFTRALPAANSGDSIWNQLPIGPVGLVRITVTIGEDGTIADSAVSDTPHKPPVHLARLAERTMLLLEGGRFALPKETKGRETLRVDVTLSDHAILDGPLALGFESPTPGNPGRAYFQLASGRVVDAKVTIEGR